ncbi:MAG TPA: TonB family protein [Opitutaceae bacterium]|nr:TonB family protein [Opitutaceae bacterium]
MHANSPSSYVASLALHALAAAVIFAATFWLARQPAEVPPVIFELVSGPPTNPNATVAGTGAPEVDVDLPKIKPLAPEAMRPPAAETPAPEPPKAEPKQAVRPEPKQAVKTPPKQEPKKTETKKPAEEPAKMSYDQFVKQHGKPQPRQTTKAPTSAKAPQIKMGEVLKDWKQGGGGQGGTAETREDQGLLANYLAQLRQALFRAYERPPGVDDGLVAEVTFSLAANGDISNVRITGSSGDADFDRAAVEAFRRVGSIGPPPTRRSGVWTLKFRATDG